MAEQYMFPNNSEMAKKHQQEQLQPQPQPQNTEPVIQPTTPRVTGTLKKRGPFAQFLYDVVDLEDIPGKFKKFKKDQVEPFVTDGLNKGLKYLVDVFTHREGAASSSSSPSKGGIVAWSPYRSQQPQPSVQKDIQQAPSTFYFDEIEYDTMGKAEIVLEDMRGYFRRYEKVPVAFLYEDSGITNTTANMETFGWTDLADLTEPRARVERKMNGKYRIRLPKPQPIRTR